MGSLHLDLLYFISFPMYREKEKRLALGSRSSRSRGVTVPKERASERPTWRPSSKNPAVRVPSKSQSSRGQVERDHHSSQQRQIARSGLSAPLERSHHPGSASNASSRSNGGRSAPPVAYSIPSSTISSIQPLRSTADRELTAALLSSVQTHLTHGTSMQSVGPPPSSRRQYSSKKNEMYSNSGMPNHLPSISPRCSRYCVCP